MATVGEIIYMAFDTLPWSVSEILHNCNKAPLTVPIPFYNTVVQEQWVCIKCCANLGKSVMETMAIIRHSGKKAWAIYGCLNDMSELTETKKCEIRISPRGPNSQFCIQLWLLWWLRENVGRLHCELQRQRNWLLHHNNAPSHNSFFTS
jgi:hypothetical protein